MFQVDGITYMDWPIECTPKAQFIVVFEIEGVAQIHW
jgi:hypothetical protein